MRAEGAIVEFVDEPFSVRFIRHMALNGQHNGYTGVCDQKLELLGLQRKIYGAGNLGRRLDTSWDEVRIQSFEKAMFQLIADGEAE
jgi:hypothetical protein